ncbi:fumarylacetoacetate hydrolase family protein [Pseudomonas sp. NY15374]|uniref:fumarylacetoacetate hydrolase family protein n=1 Tax=Pseudomonas sp. NY15374 TaxID=3400357 RepID=UPI003A83C276
MSKADSLNQVYRNTVVNHVSTRDLQVRHQRCDLCKSRDAFCPMGPWLFTADELDGCKSRVRCWSMASFAKMAD